MAIALLVAAVAAALFGAWGVYLQITARRPLLTASFAGWSTGTLSVNEQPIFSLPVIIQNDGTTPVSVRVIGIRDGIEIQPSAVANLAPGAKSSSLGFLVERSDGEQDPGAGHELQARIEYNGRSRILNHGDWEVTLR